MGETLKVLSEEQAQVLTEKLLLNDKAIKDELNAKIPTDYLTSIPEEYVTETELSDAIANIQVGEDVDLSDYALKTEIPTKTSELINDSNFLTTIPSEYITESELNAKGYLTEHQDLSGYALKTDIPSVPTKVSELSNDSNFISEIPTEYITESELNAKGYLTEHQDLSNYATLSALDYKSNVVHTHTLSDITDYTETDLSNYATKSEIPDVSDFVTESQMNEAIANVSTGGTIDLSGYATKTELNGKADVEHTHSIDDITDYSVPDLSGYATESYVDQKITEVQSYINQQIGGAINGSY